MKGLDLAQWPVIDSELPSQASEGELENFELGWDRNCGVRNAIPPARCTGPNPFKDGPVIPRGRDKHAKEFERMVLFEVGEGSPGNEEWRRNGGDYATRQDEANTLLGVEGEPEPGHERSDVVEHALQMGVVRRHHGKVIGIGREPHCSSAVGEIGMFVQSPYLGNDG